MTQTEQDRIAAETIEQFKAISAEQKRREQYRDMKTGTMEAQYTRHHKAKKARQDVHGD